MAGMRHKNMQRTRGRHLHMSHNDEKWLKDCAQGSYPTLITVIPLSRKLSSDYTVGFQHFAMNYITQ